MLTNLINRIIELATGRVVDAVNTDEVQSAAVERLVGEGIDYNTLVDEIDMSTIAGEICLGDLAGEFDTYDLARELADSRQLRDNIIEALVETRDFNRAVEDVVETQVGAMYDRVAVLESRLDAMPEPVEAEPTTVEVPASLTERLLDMAVMRLLTMADEAVRDGKV
jgi:hypothetical protein